MIVCECWPDMPETFGDAHRSEPSIVWHEQHLGNRIVHQVFPHHWARVLIAKRTQQRYADD